MASWVVAITGSIATGKSTARQFFADNGIPTISADDINRSLLQPGTETYQQILLFFGPDIVDSEGRISRQALRDRISNNPSDKQWLESLLHPIIRHRMAEEVKQANGPYVVIEIPLLKNLDDFPYVNRVLLITADTDIQIQRIKSRDNCSEAQAQAMINNHPSASIRNQIANDIIDNSKDEAAFIAQLELLHQSYLDKYSSHADI